MFEKLEITRMAQAMASHAGARMGVVSQNIANADTPGYKARDLPDFAQAYQAQGAMKTTRAGHLGAAEQPVPAPRGQTAMADPNGNTVSLEAEMVKAVEVRQQHDMALSIYRATSDMLRTSLGRR